MAAARIKARACVKQIIKRRKRRQRHESESVAKHNGGGNEIRIYGIISGSWRCKAKIIGSGMAAWLEGGETSA